YRKNAYCTALALVRLLQMGCTELTAHPRPRMIRLATRKHRLLLRVPEWEPIRISYLVGNVTEPVAERLAKKLCVRDAEENQHAQRRDGDQEEEDGEEESLQQSGKTAKCCG